MRLKSLKVVDLESISCYGLEFVHFTIVEAALIIKSQYESPSLFEESLIN